MGRNRETWSPVKWKQQPRLVSKWTHYTGVWPKWPRNANVSKGKSRGTQRDPKRSKGKNRSRTLKEVEKSIMEKNHPRTQTPSQHNPAQRSNLSRNCLKILWCKRKVLELQAVLDSEL